MSDTATSSRAPVLQLSDVRLRLGERFTLDVPELTIGPGITVVRGANGSGKSTLLRALATVLAPDEGRLVADGRALDDPVALTALRRRLGYLPQGESVPSRLRVFDHVDVVAVMRELTPDGRRRRALVHRALVDAGVADLAGERCGRLSGGQRRRVALAAALTGDPAVLVLDEPDASIDADHLTAVADELRRRSRNATIVVASHHASWSDALEPTHTLHLEAGRITRTN